MRFRITSPICLPEKKTPAFAGVRQSLRLFAALLVVFVILQRYDQHVDVDSVNQLTR